MSPDPRGRHAEPTDSRSADSLGSQDDPRVASALAAYLAELEAGRRPSREELLERNPEIAEALADCLDVVEFVHSAAGAGSSDVPLPPAKETLPPDTILGEYRLVREIGRGGMGIVYEAEQVSLGRRVALKVLSGTAALDPSKLQRFRIETQAVAQLHHPHIVPIFAVGSEHGTQYYAMPYIEGPTLADVIHQQRQFGRGAAGGVDAGRTSPVAGETAPHPAAAAGESSANGAGDRVYEVSPSGLADSATSSLRGRGAFPGAGAVGHPGRRGPRPCPRDGHPPPRHQALQPPGRRQGKPLGHRFRPRAIPGRAGADPDRRPAGHPALHRPRTGAGPTDGLRPALRHLLARCDPVRAADAAPGVRRPRPPGAGAADRPGRTDPAEAARPGDPARPRDDRPEGDGQGARSPLRDSARELGEDLRRFLEDRPIRARRPTTAERAAKWARRHRAVLGATATVVFLALAIATPLLWWQQQKTARMYEGLRISFAQADLGFARFEQMIRLSDELTMKGMARYAQSSPFPEAQRIRSAFFQQAIEFYDQLVREPDVPKPMKALAYRRMGFSRMMGMQDLRAQDDFRRSLALYEELLAASPRDPPLRDAVADVRKNLGIVLMVAGRRDPAVESFHAATSMDEGLVSEFPDEPGYLEQLTDRRLEIANWLGTFRMRPQAEQERQSTSRVLRETGDRRGRVARPRSGRGRFLPPPRSHARTDGAASGTAGSPSPGIEAQTGGAGLLHRPRLVPGHLAGRDIGRVGRGDRTGEAGDRSESGGARRLAARWDWPTCERVNGRSRPCSRAVDETAIPGWRRRRSAADGDG